MSTPPIAPAGSLAALAALDVAAVRALTVMEAGQMVAPTPAPAPEAPPSIPPPPSPVALATQTAAGRQTSLAPLFADLSAALGSAELPAPVAAAAAKVQALATPLDPPPSGADLKAAANQSGLMLEATLAATGAPPPADLKAALLVLRQTLAAAVAETPQPTAPSPESTAAAPAPAPAPPATPPVAQAAPEAPAQPTASTPSQTAPSPAPAASPAPPVVQTAPAAAASPSTAPAPPQTAPVLPQTEPAPPPTASQAPPVAETMPRAPTLGPSTAQSAPAPTDLTAQAQPPPVASPLAAPAAPAPPPTRTDAPPPPYRDGPLQAQPPATAQIAADTPTATLVRALLHGVDGALARQVLFQLASLPDAPRVPGDASARQWAFELPLASQAGVTPTPFEISRDGGHGPTGDQGGEPTWRARFSLDLGGGGPVHAHVSLQNGRARVSLWAEQPDTAAALDAERAALATDLAGQNFEPSVAVFPGHPASPAADPGRFLDQAL